MARILSPRRVAAGAALLITALFVTGCGGFISTDAASEQSDGGVGMPPMADTVTGESAASDMGVTSDSRGDAANVAEADRLIIRTKTLRLEVESTSETVDAIRTLVADHGGTVTNLQVATATDDWVYYYDESGYSSDALRGWVTVRVPAEGLEAFFAAATKLGTVKYQSEASDDVTQQHVDLSARLDNLRAEELRLREFFDAAKNVTEMLAIEQELSRVRGEIESLDAQVKYLERQAAMATVTIELTEPQDLVRPDGESWGFGDAVTSGFRGAAGVVKVAITFVIATAPLWVLGLVAFFVIRAIVRRRRSRSAGGATVPPDATPHDGPEQTA